MLTCASVNTPTFQVETFFDGPLEKHEIGWLLAGIACGITSLISLAGTWQHATHYYKPAQQKNSIRIIWMPMIYGWCQFGGYRFYRAYEYWELGGLTYEALALMAFLNLLLGYLGETSEHHASFMQSQAKTGLPWPFGRIRFRPGEPYFLHALTASVVQYCVVRPLISVIAAICEYYHVLCTDNLQPYWAAAWLEATDFFSMGLALYGLVCLYTLTKTELTGRRPLAKFMSIKLVVALTYYQGFIFTALAQNDVIKGTTYWTPRNIASGLNCLVACVEMIFFAAGNFYAFSATEYRKMRTKDRAKTKPWQALLDACNFIDFVQGAIRAGVFAFNYLRGFEGTQSYEGYVLVWREDLERAGVEFIDNKPAATVSIVKRQASDGSEKSINSADFSFVQVQPKGTERGFTLPQPGSSAETWETLRSRSGSLKNSPETMQSSLKPAYRDSLGTIKGEDIMSVADYSRAICGSPSTPAVPFVASSRSTQSLHETNSSMPASIQEAPPSILFPDQVACGDAVYVDSPTSIDISRRSQSIKAGVQT